LATRELVRILTAGSGGVLETVAGLLLSDTGDSQAMPEASIGISYVSAETAEKSGGASYPALCVYCERVVNELREKFRTFSGTVGLTIDVRISHDRADAIGDLLDIYVDAVTDVLNRARGEWCPGVYYPGGYEVTFSAAKKGGRNYFQTAKVRLEVILSL
jgi:hypothetical protein